MSIGLLSVQINTIVICEIKMPEHSMETLPKCLEARIRLNAGITLLLEDKLRLNPG